MAAPWVNPIGRGAQPARIDMGVDYTGVFDLYALGDGTVRSLYNAGWPGGTFISIELDGDGRFIFYAENIAVDPAVHVGGHVRAGQRVGHARGTSPFVEIGWAAPPGTGQTMAALSGQARAGQAHGDPGRYSTAYGVNMSNLIGSLGGPRGIVVPPIQGSVPPSWGSGQPDQGTGSSGAGTAAAGELAVAALAGLGIPVAMTAVILIGAVVAGSVLAAVIALALARGRQGGGQDDR